MANRRNKKAHRSEQHDGPEHRTDEAVGSEGIEDPAMEASRQQGRELMDDASGFGGQGAQREGSPNPEGTGYTGNEDRSTTEDTDSENPLA